MEFVLVDGDGGCRRQSNRLATTEETTFDKGQDKRAPIDRKGNTYVLPCTHT